MRFHKIPKPIFPERSGRSSERGAGTIDGGETPDGDGPLVEPLRADFSADLCGLQGCESAEVIVS